MENKMETFIDDDDSSPMIIGPVVPPLLTDVPGVRRQNPVEKVIRVQGVHVNDGGPCLWYASFYTKYGRELSFEQYEQFKKMCVTLADIYRDTLLFSLDGTQIRRNDSGCHLTFKGFIEWKMENVMFPVRAVSGSRETGNLVVHDMSQYDNNELQEWYLVTFEELLLLLLHPVKRYPFADIIGRLLATVLKHILFVKSVTLDTCRPVIGSTPEYVPLTMASAAVNGIFQGLIGVQIMVGGLFVEVLETVSTTICSNNTRDASWVSPKGKRQRVRSNTPVLNKDKSWLACCQFFFVLYD